MISAEKRVYNKLKGTEIDKLTKIVEDWFHSDLDIEFELRRGQKKLHCDFESDVWYEHIGSPTTRSIRHGGNRRRLYVYEGDDDLYEEVKNYCNVLYTKEELLELIEILGDEYVILVP